MIATRTRLFAPTTFACAPKALSGWVAAAIVAAAFALVFKNSLLLSSILYDPQGFMFRICPPLRVGCVASILLGHMRLLVITIVDEHTILKIARFPSGNRIAAVLLRIVKEERIAERICGQQSVATSMPIGGMTKTPGAIENRDA